jgi:hypothetical protein
LRADCATSPENKLGNSAATELGPTSGASNDDVAADRGITLHDHLPVTPPHAVEWAATLSGVP